MITNLTATTFEAAQIAGALGLASATSTGVFGSARAEETTQGSAIRLFRIDVPDEALIDLRRRLASLVLLRRRVTSNM
jgi:hypothetical protein